MAGCDSYLPTNLDEGTW